jgi:hypothetical protein
MQPAKLVRRQAAPLLFEILHAVLPRCHARIGAQLGRQIGEVGVGATVAAVPREQHTRIGAGEANLLEVE